MGGTIAVTLITPEGHTYKMGRWTNSLPWFVGNLDFVNKKKEHIDEYMKTWFEMKDDWEKNGPSGPFEWAMTPAYAFHNVLAPTGYGLVLVDMQKEVIYSMQGYSSLDRIYGVFDEETKERLKALENAKRVSIVKNKRDFKRHELDLSPFVIRKYEESSDGARQMLEDIQKEYQLTEDELEAWDLFIQDRFYDEYEE